MICYYGAHYMSIFWSDEHRAWLIFNDKRVSLIGKWRDVVEKCVNGRLQPTVLFYESLQPDAHISPLQR